MLKTDLKKVKENDKYKVDKQANGTPVKVSGDFRWYGGAGSILPNVEITTIFLGSNWSKNTNLITSVNQFFTDITTRTTYITNLSEYSADGLTIGAGKLVKTITIPDHLTSSLSDYYLQNRIKSLINARTLPTPNVNSLYFVFIDPSATVFMADGSQSSVDFLGYHGFLNTTPTSNYAIIPFPSDSDVSEMGLSTTIDAMTVISSHELGESITDSGASIGWYDMNNGEIGDICEGYYKTITVGSNTWAVQYLYSQINQDCQ